MCIANTKRASLRTCIGSSTAGQASSKRGIHAARRTVARTGFAPEGKGRRVRARRVRRGLVAAGESPAPRCVPWGGRRHPDFSMARVYNDFVRLRFVEFPERRPPPGSHRHQSDERHLRLGGAENPTRISLGIKVVDGTIKDV